MKRRNADTGKMRRPVKRTKITEGMYGNSLMYLKFVMVWAFVVMADYMLEFRLELLWPFWMMVRSVYDSFKYQGIAFSVFFICIALTSDMICFFFIPLQYIFFAASTYVWVQYVWYTFADKGICLPTVAICCVLVYVEGALRAERSGAGVELCRPLAAHCVGYPVVTLGFGVKSYVGHRLRLRRQRQVRQENEFYFQLMREALPESAMETQQQQTPSSDRSSTHAPANGECGGGGGGAQAAAGAGAGSQAAAGAGAGVQTDVRHMNGSVRRKCREQNGVPPDVTPVTKLEKEKVERPVYQKCHSHTNGAAVGAPPPPAPPPAPPADPAPPAPTAHTAPAAHTGPAPPVDDTRHDYTRGGVKSSKCEKKEANMLKEERRKNKSKDKDKDNNSDSHKSTTEQTKEHIVKEVESTKENHIKNHKECKDKERDKEREKERERERERELREREKEREREQREALAEELKRVKGELAGALRAEAEARRTLAASAAADRQRRADHTQLKQAHAALQHKVSQWRSTERAALERRLGEERRARTAAEHQLRAHAVRQANHTGECENEWCRSRVRTCESEASALRRELRRAHDRRDQLQRDLAAATEQVRSLESRECTTSTPPGCGGAGGAGGDTGGRQSALAGACAALQERAKHLERALSAETRVKLDLLSALGDAKRQLTIQEGLISRQEKEMEELKAQMLAVMPTEYVTSVSGTISKMRLESSPLDPNASVYTPKQLCSDA